MAQMSALDRKILLWPQESLLTSEVTKFQLQLADPELGLFCMWKTSCITSNPSGSDSTQHQVLLGGAECINPEIS